MKGAELEKIVHELNQKDGLIFICKLLLWNEASSVFAWFWFFFGFVFPAEILLLNLEMEREREGDAQSHAET